MALTVFSETWAEAWCAEINASDAYRDAGRSWTGPVVLVEEGGGPDDRRGVFADLREGECREARTLAPGDEERATVVIGASREVWERVLDGKVDPILGLLKGTLRLEKGQMARLVPHARGSKELVAAAARLDGVFPGDPTEESHP